jgi:hypothetical protein
MVFSLVEVIPSYRCPVAARYEFNRSPHTVGVSESGTDMIAYKTKEQPCSFFYRQQEVFALDV